MRFHVVDIHKQHFHSAYAQKSVFSQQYRQCFATLLQASDRQANQIMFDAVAHHWHRLQIKLRQF